MLSASITIFLKRLLLVPDDSLRLLLPDCLELLLEVLDPGLQLGAHLLQTAHLLPQDLVLAKIKLLRFTKPYLQGIQRLMLI